MKFCKVLWHSWLTILLSLTTSTPSQSWGFAVAPHTSHPTCSQEQDVLSSANGHCGSRCEERLIILFYNRKFCSRCEQSGHCQCPLVTTYRCDDVYTCRSRDKYYTKTTTTKNWWQKLLFLRDIQKEISTLTGFSPKWKYEDTKLKIVDLYASFWDSEIISVHTAFRFSMKV